MEIYRDSIRLCRSTRACAGLGKPRQRPLQCHLALTRSRPAPVGRARDRFPVVQGRSELRSGSTFFPRLRAWTKGRFRSRGGMVRYLPGGGPISQHARFSCVGFSCSSRSIGFLRGFLDSSREFSPRHGLNPAPAPMCSPCAPAPGQPAGLSPRGRGSRHAPQPDMAAQGSIPAWAGEPVRTRSPGQPNPCACSASAYCRAADSRFART